MNQNVIQINILKTGDDSAEIIIKYLAGCL
jgi:hypothetical protein